MSFMGGNPRPSEVQTVGGGNAAAAEFLRSHWQSAWAGLGVATANNELYQRILNSYAELHRHYHTLQHIRECFAHFDQIHHLCQRPAELALAIWFHDAVYDVRANDNEQNSARWARACLDAATLPSEISQRVSQLIRSTAHHSIPQDNDEKLLSDIDLCIFSSNQVRFDEYERQVRAEYGWVPGFVYRRERKKVLNSFLQRPAIYFSPYFYERHEVAARHNLRRSLGLDE